jgi:hypothetical protein
MNRREILKFAASLTGSAIIAPLSVNLLTNLTANSSANLAGKGSLTQLAFFTPEQFTLITHIMDVILPRTDSPSASDVKTNWIMDNMFNTVFEDKYKMRFIKNLKLLQTHLAKQHFSNESSSSQLAILLELETAPKEQRDNVHRAFTDIKQQTISYYLATETIAEQHLNYLPIPGAYTACVSLEEVGGKAWAE